MRVKMNTVVAVFCLGLLVSSGLFAAEMGTTGTLTGRITDVTSGEALPGVNILIVGTGRGTVSDINGKFAIVGVTPGTYTVTVSLIGYKSFDAKKVVIDADQTTVYNFKMASTDIEMEGVTVEGQRPLVDVRKTAGDQTYGKDKIEQLPNVKGVEDVLALQAGVVKFGGQLFLRGGRANETQILIDGVPVNDVGGGSRATGTQNTNEQLAQLYSGTSTGSGGGALSIAANAIASVSVSSSGLDAEFGNAQSGIVNITSKSGGDNFGATGQYRTDGIGGRGFGDRYYAGTFSGPEPITMKLLPSLGITVPGKLNFFLSSNFNQVDGPYTYTENQFYNPVKRKVRFGGFFGRVLDGLGFTYADKQSNDFSFSGKLTYGIGDNDQFSYNYRANVSTSRPLSSGYSWRDRYDSTTSSSNLNTQNVLSWTRILGRNTLLRGYLSRIETDRLSTIGNLSPDMYSTVTNFSTTNYRDLNSDGFNDIGGAQNWSKSNTVVWNTKFDYSTQLADIHFFKTGVEYFYEHIQSTSISYPLAKERQVDSVSRGLFPGLGLGRWIGNNTPSRGAVYVQDNIEMRGLNIKVGLRYDYFYPGKQIYAKDFIDRYERVINDTDPVTPWSYAEWTNRSSANPDEYKANSFMYHFFKGNISPRLAIGYPISARTVFYFNYGHFLQYPDRNQYFQDPYYDAGASLGGNYVGNPALKPQRTIQYEAGFDQLIFDQLSLGIRGYYKDIFDYATSMSTRLSGRTVSRFINLDYASTRGFEIILTKGLSDNYSGSIGYTFQLAKGRSSDPFASQITPGLQGLPREVRLDYDQQHTVSMYFGYRVGPNEEYEVFGLPLNNWSASVTWNFGSGFPYTPYNPGTTLADVYLKNTGDGPYTSQVNIALSKGFIILDRLNAILTLDVSNLFNRRNVNMSGGSFNTLLGRPTIYGDYAAANPKNIYSWGGLAGSTSYDARVSPFGFAAPRQISLGVKINWN